MLEVLLLLHQNIGFFETLLPAFTVLTAVLNLQYSDTARIQIYVKLILNNKSFFSNNVIIARH